MGKTASLVFFYFGENSYLNRLAQETVPVAKALDGYDRQIVLRHDTDAGPFKLSAKAGRAADVVDLPTKENLAKYLNELGASGHVTDLYIFSHGWDRQFRVSAGSYGDNSAVHARWLRHHIQPLKLRAVWGVNCYGSTLADTWHSLGARAVAGARYVNFYPTRFKHFITAWNTRTSFEEAVAVSNRKLSRFPVHAYIAADAIGTRKKWGGCPCFRTVLGKHPCAERYFQHRWLPEDEWEPGLSGGDNMKRSSEMVLSGDGSLTKADT